jgi:hypothetical protein
MMNSSRLLPASIPLFPRRKARWPEPELSTERYRGIKKGKNYYWDTRGPAREAFEKLKGQIKDHLNSAGIPVPSSSFIQFDMFMIGKTQATANPYIMFSCKHLESRKAAVAVIKDSKILDQCPPGIRIGDWDYPPHLKNLRTLALSALSSDAVTDTIWVDEAAIGSYICSVYPVVDLKSGKNRVLRLTTRNESANDKHPCMATIGSIIEIHGKRFFLVPAHVFDSQGDTASDTMSKEMDLLSEDSECDLGDSDSDDESSSGPQEESDFMSQYSESPRTSDVEEDWDLDDTNTISDGESVQGFDVRSAQPPSIVTTNDEASLSVDEMEMSSLHHLAFSIARFPRLISDSLDYCLIEIVDEEKISTDLPVLSRENIGELNQKPLNVTTVTGSGNILKGVLSSQSSCIRLPNATKYIDILFVQFEGSLQPGDCGSIVRDVSTGKIYGHIVAGDTESQSALIVPTADVLDDVVANFFEPATDSADHRPLPPSASETPFSESKYECHTDFQSGPSGRPFECIEDSSSLSTSLDGPNLVNEDHELLSEETWHVAPFNSKSLVEGEPHTPVFPPANLTAPCASLRTIASHNALDSPNSHAVAWIVALPIEQFAAGAMLDEQHAAPTGFTRYKTDANAYTLGRIGGHNVTIASLPSIRVGLSVGIGGGIARPNEDYDIRLGGVIVNQPDRTTRGVCQCDLIKAKSGDRNERKSLLGQPPTVLLNALASIQANHEWKDSKAPYFLQKILEKNPRIARRSKQNPSYTHRGFNNDRLFRASCDHLPGPDCRGCDTASEVQRDPRGTTDPDIHYGTILSSNTFVQDAATRDRIIASFSLCYEMEAAGLMNHFPCLVIRGICDYADSHKNNQWQRYASATAAAYAKELLAHVPAAEVQGTKRALEMPQSSEFLFCPLTRPVTTRDRIMFELDIRPNCEELKNRLIACSKQ